jgi:hippurate hydrolase
LIDAVASVVGQHALETQTPPLMASEDFGFMLRERPGAYIFLGNGDSRPLHHAAYDFNDDALRYGIALWVALVQSRLRRA